jgi:hypothetical protein
METRTEAAGSMGKRLRLWICGIAVGTAYGAACGAIIGTVTTLESGMDTGDPIQWHFVILGMARVFAAVGGVFGALCGVIAGLVAASCRNRRAWYLAIGVGGGLAITLLVLFAIGSSAAVLPAVLAGVLVAVVCHGLVSGRSPLPGIQRLATLAKDTNPRSLTARPNSTPHEPMPATLPQGRGHEPNPSSMASTEHGGEA